MPSYTAFRDFIFPIYKHVQRTSPMSAAASEASPPNAAAVKNTALDWAGPGHSLVVPLAHPMCSSDYIWALSGPLALPVLPASQAHGWGPPRDMCPPRCQGWGDGRRDSFRSPEPAYLLSLGEQEPPLRKKPQERLERERPCPLKGACTPQAPCC